MTIPTSQISPTLRIPPIQIIIKSLRNLFFLGDIRGGRIPVSRESCEYNFTLLCKVTINGTDCNADWSEYEAGVADIKQHMNGIIMSNALISDSSGAPNENISEMSQTPSFKIKQQRFKEEVLLFTT